MFVEDIYFDFFSPGKVGRYQLTSCSDRIVKPLHTLIGRESQALRDVCPSRYRRANAVKYSRHAAGVNRKRLKTSSRASRGHVAPRAPSPTKTDKNRLFFVCIFFSPREQREFFRPNLTSSQRYRRRFTARRRVHGKTKENTIKTSTPRTCLRHTARSCPSCPRALRDRTSRPHVSTYRVITKTAASIGAGAVL